MTSNRYPLDVNDWPKVQVYGSDFRTSLLNMANSITEKELWNWLKEYSPNENEGFMFSNHPNLNIIGNSKLVQSDGHSGATFAYAFRCMECIAKKGFKSFETQFNQ